MRILASWELGLGYGHVATLAPACRAIRLRGHHVTLAARTPKTAGLEPGAFDAVEQAPAYTGAIPARETLTYGQVIAPAGFVDGPGAIAMVAQWLALFERLGPDALIAEHAPMSLLAAHVAGLPTVRLGSSFVAPSARNAGASLLPWAAHDARTLAEAGHAADAAIAAACRHYGAPMLRSVSDLLAGTTLHSLAWPELDHYGPGASRFYYGPLIAIRAGCPPEWPAGQGPRVLVYLPFDRPAGKLAAQALAGLGWPTLWHSPCPPSEALAGNIRYCEAPIDLAAAARDAALYVGRGGYGASAVMVAGGVPQLLLPDTLESLLLTYRLSRAGVAHSQAASAGADAIGEALRAVAASDAIRIRAVGVAARHADHSVHAMTEMLADDLLIGMTA